MKNGNICILNDDIKEIVANALELFMKGPLVRKAFRQNYENKKETIDYLEKIKIFKIESENPNAKTYYLSDLCLYLADSGLSESILSDISNLCSFCQKVYASNEADTVNVKAKDISEKLNISRSRLEKCMHFLLQTISMGRTTNLSDNDAAICLNDCLDDFDNYAEFLNHKFTSRFIEKSENPEKKEKRHGNTDVHASKREEVLGAALAVLAAFPDQCKSSSGNIIVSKISKLIDQKSTLLFSTTNGNPPLSLDTISRLLNKWVKLLE